MSRRGAAVGWGGRYSGRRSPGSTDKGVQGCLTQGDLTRWQQGDLGRGRYETARLLWPADAVRKLLSELSRPFSRDATVGECGADQCPLSSGEDAGAGGGCAGGGGGRPDQGREEAEGPVPFADPRHHPHTQD